MIFTKAQKNSIKRVKAIVKKLEKEQNKEFTALCKQLGIKPFSTMGEYLFDYIYNDFGTIRLVENGGNIKLD